MFFALFHNLCYCLGSSGTRSSSCKSILSVTNIMFGAMSGKVLYRICVHGLICFLADSVKFDWISGVCWDWLTSLNISGACWPGGSQEASGGSF